MEYQEQQQQQQSHTHPYEEPRPQKRRSGEEPGGRGHEGGKCKYLMNYNDQQKWGTQTGWGSVSARREEFDRCQITLKGPNFNTPFLPSTYQQFKKASAVGLAVVLSGIILVGGMPVVSHAASASLAELTAGASSSYNSVVAKLAASGFLQVCRWFSKEEARTSCA